ncbi:DNA topoisomerase IV subunit A [Macrococcus hajekii]|uniref:DNA topoisomerase 4 subunit A n=1 Tax=Macrococcus hajekii TaxID=198482 RepID=A0A4R6BN03_9STAP|nr:DNA topoisomerase IV subunit A [Macrococcus hajekii]TDM03072.1 DNA topoisomerase IV subunit A [Macrococcus hajekii]GGB06335.1 DNA topoisomerase 4 subunit A [Macrococcus hajekii]
MAEQIQILPLEDVVGDRFARYSKYIIQDRAIPDVRDGLKPVQRRILFAMHQEGNTYDKNFRKSAKTVGNVIGNYHPHGDTSVYDAMVRMSQNWKLRHVLVEMHGNNGSIDNDPPAAMRYTEAKLSKLADLLLKDIQYETVDYVQNFDDTAMEPVVLPARYPNLLVNGSTGISAGYATDIPTHNLKEVIDATLLVMENPEVDIERIMQVMPGPDFATGGIIQGKAGIRQAYETGKGKIVVRGKVETEELRGGRSQIIVSEIPYEVNKGVLVKRIDELRADKKVDGILEVRDESDRQGLRIAIELKKDANAEGILNFLYKNTELQINYNFNMVAISDRRPKLLGVREMLDSYIRHQYDVVTRRSDYQLQQAQRRMHIVEGLIKIISILDEVIEVIRHSNNKQDAKQNLVDQFDFTMEQAEAIVTLQLYRLTNTDIVALEKEHDELANKIKELAAILADPKKLKQVIRKELKQVQKEYGEDRLSQVEDKVAEIKISKDITVPNEEVIVSLTRDGYVKRTSIRSYGASETQEVGVKEGDMLLSHVQTNLQHTLLVFTALGHYLYIPVVNLPDIKWKELGTHISQIVPLKEQDSVIGMAAVPTFDTEQYVVSATQNGMIKKTPLRDYQTSRFTRPIVGMKLKADDKVISSEVVTGDHPIIVITKNGYSLVYALDEVSEMGLKAAGVKSINLKEDEVIATRIITEGELLIATQRGAVKRMKLDIEPGKRANRGLLLLKELKSNPHRIVDAWIVQPENQYQLISDKGEAVVNPVKSVRLTERYTNGSFAVDENSFGKVVAMHIID